MKKSLALVVLAVLAMAVPASAQRIAYIPSTPDGWYYRVVGDQVQMLTADNLGMVRGMSDQLRRTQIRSLRDELRWNGDAYGINVGRRFLPMYDRQMRPMGRREATVTGAAIGAGVGYGVSGNARGTVIGGVAGAIVGLLTHRGKNRQHADQDGVPGDEVDNQPNRQAGPVSSPPSMAGEWRVTNRTSKRAELWDGERFVARVEPGQSVQVDVPEKGYKATLLIPNRSGGLDQEIAQIRASSSFNGWDIIAPAVQ